LRAAGFRIAASVPYITEAVLDSLSHDQIILLVLDAGTMLERATGQIEAFKRRCPDGRVAVLASYYRLVDIVSAFQAGANSQATPMPNNPLVLLSVDAWNEYGCPFVPVPFSS